MGKVMEQVNAGLVRRDAGAPRWIKSNLGPA